MTLAGELGARVRYLHAAHRPAAGELEHVAPAAAARVEDAGTGRQAQCGDDALQHLPAPAIPPMPILGAVRLKLVVSLHPRSIFS